jgi:acylphosphatase
MPCQRLLISGRVQGVWFRESMKREAEQLDITGWVRNLSDGRVEAVVCGSEPALQAIQKWAAKGPPLAQVSDVEVHPVQDEAYSDFEKRS